MHAPAPCEMGKCHCRQMDGIGSRPAAPGTLLYCIFLLLTVDVDIEFESLFIIQRHKGPRKRRPLTSRSSRSLFPHHIGTTHVGLPISSPSPPAHMNVFAVPVAIHSEEIGGPGQSFRSPAPLPVRCFLAERRHESGDAS